MKFFIPFHCVLLGLYYASIPVDAQSTDGEEEIYFTAIMDKPVVAKEEADKESGQVDNTSLHGEETPENNAPANMQEKPAIPDHVRFKEVEDHFMENFRDTTKVEWHLATIFLDMKAMLKICKCLKKYRNIEKRISNTKISTSPLIFREASYNSKIIDVLACEIANSKYLPGGRQYFYVTRGKKDKTFYLLIKIPLEPEERYHLDEFVSLEHMTGENEMDQEEKIRSIWSTDL